MISTELVKIQQDINYLKKLELISNPRLQDVFQNATKVLKLKMHQKSLQDLEKLTSDLIHLEARLKDDIKNFRIQALEGNTHYCFPFYKTAIMIKATRESIARVKQIDEEPTVCRDNNCKCMKSKGFKVVKNAFLFTYLAAFVYVGWKYVLPPSVK